jgi:hypothetical protein
MHVRQSVLVADTLIGQYKLGLERMIEAWKNPDQGEHMETMRADLERSYVAIWEQLDSAAKLTQSAGRSAAAYAEIRATPGLEVNVAVADANEKYLGSKIRGTRVVEKFQLNVKHNHEGIAFARKAVAALKAAWPELDWVVVDEPVVDLRPGGIGRLIVGLSRLFGRRN